MRPSPRESGRLFLLVDDVLSISNDGDEAHGNNQLIQSRFTNVVSRCLKESKQFP